MRCDLFGDARRPALCNAFAPERELCGDNREQALALLGQLEMQSLPNSIVLGGEV